VAHRTPKHSGRALRHEKRRLFVDRDPNSSKFCLRQRHQSPLATRNESAERVSRYSVFEENSVPLLLRSVLA